MQDLADQHVLWIADQGPGRAHVGRARQRDEVRHGIQAAARAEAHEDRRHREADDVVGEDRREPAGGEDHEGEQAFRRVVRRAEAGGDGVVEAAEPELRRDHHQAEQEGDGRDVHRGPRRVERHAAGGDERDGAKQRDARAVQREARQLAQDHPEVDKGEDAGDDEIH